MNNTVITKIAELIIGSEFEGHTYLVGGCVRDYIMGHQCKDYDLCVSLEDGGIRLAEYLINNFPTICQDYAVFQTYGTAKLTMCVDGHKEDIEIVETRKERYDNIDSRNPSCVFGTIDEDCFRRDLTINTLYMDITSNKILDLTNTGISDIKSEIIRTPCDPNITFSDDPLRMMRCIRFASRYGWDIESCTMKGIVDNAHRIGIISKERIADELCKILLTDNPRRGLSLLMSSGILSHILPEFNRMSGLGQNEYHNTDVWNHTLDVVEKTPNILVCRIAALFHDLGKINTYSVDDNGKVHFYKHELESGVLVKDILSRLKFPNSIISDVYTIVTNHMRTKSFGDDAKASKKVFRKLKCDMGDLLDEFLFVVDADNKSHSVKGIMPNQVDNIRKAYLTLSEESSDISKITLPINGKDVLEVLKISPGPIVKQVLEYITELYLEDPNISREVCLKHIETYGIDKQN